MDVIVRLKDRSDTLSTNNSIVFTFSIRGLGTPLQVNFQKFSMNYAILGVPSGLQGLYLRKYKHKIIWILLLIFMDFILIL